MGEGGCVQGCLNASLMLSHSRYDAHTSSLACYMCKVWFIVQPDCLKQHKVGLFRYVRNSVAFIQQMISLRIRGSVELSYWGVWIWSYPLSRYCRSSDTCFWTNGHKSGIPNDKNVSYHHRTLLAYSDVLFKIIYCVSSMFATPRVPLVRCDVRKWSSTIVLRILRSWVKWP